MANGRKRRRTAAPRRTSPLHGLRVVLHEDGAAGIEAQRRPRVAHFDHDGLPRATSARGASAHGFFQLYESCADFTQAAFLCDPAARTPAFVQFSSVLAARRGADTVRDVRGFSVKLFTAEGNFDLLGQSSPVLYVHEGVRFPDTFHARAPDPMDTPFDPDSASLAPMKAALWRYACEAPGATSSLLWLLSERAVPRSLRMMAGYAVHAYRLVDTRGVARIARFAWRPLLGVHALAPDEAELLTEEDPDFHRRDLWDAVVDGDFPEWELCVQLLDDDAQRRARELGIDVLDCSDVWPEDAFPMRALGKLTLTRNPSSFLDGSANGASTGNVNDVIDFHPSRTVPGIDFTDDPVLQTILATGPGPSLPAYLEGTAGPVTRPRAKAAVGKGTRRDPLASATRIVQALSQAEQRRLVERIDVELATLPPDLRLRARVLLRGVRGLADITASELPLDPAQHGLDDGPPAPLSSRRVAVLVADGTRLAHVEALVGTLQARGVRVDIVGRSRSGVLTDDGTPLPVDHVHRTASSVFYDALVCVPGRAPDPDALRSLEEAFTHGKPIGVLGDAAALLASSLLPHAAPGTAEADGVVVAPAHSDEELARFVESFAAAMQHHRFFERPPLREDA